MSGSLGFPLQLTDPGNYWDLRIVDDDIALDVGRQPLKLADRASIAQDIAHMIRERGYLTAMIAERDVRKRKYQMVLITIAVDDDTRIVPGTAQISESTPGELWLTAKTVEYGEFTLAMLSTSVSPTSGATADAQLTYAQSATAEQDNG